MAQELDPKVVDAQQRLVLAVMKIVYDPRVSRELVKMMRAEEPAAGLAKAAGLVLGQLRERAKGAPQGLVESAGAIIVAFLMDLAEAAQLFPKDPALMQQAMGMIQQAPQAPAEAPTEAPVEAPAPGGLIAQGA